MCRVNSGSVSDNNALNVSIGEEKIDGLIIETASSQHLGLGEEASSGIPLSPSRHLTRAVRMDRPTLVLNGLLILSLI